MLHQLQFKTTAKNLFVDLNDRDQVSLTYQLLINNSCAFAYELYIAPIYI